MTEYFGMRRTFKQNFFITSKRRFIFNKIDQEQGLQTEEGWKEDICNVEN